MYENTVIYSSLLIFHILNTSFLIRCNNSKINITQKQHICELLVCIVHYTLNNIIRLVLKSAVGYRSVVYCIIKTIIKKYSKFKDLRRHWPAVDLY